MDLLLYYFGFQSKQINFVKLSKVQHRFIFLFFRNFRKIKNIMRSIQSSKCNSGHLFLTLR